MDIATYKQLASRSDAFRRVTLTDTAVVVVNSDAALAKRVGEQLDQSPIPKPSQHGGGPDTDIFQVCLPLATVEAIVDVLSDAEAGAVAADGSTTSQASHLATL